MATKTPRPADIKAAIEKGTDSPYFFTRDTMRYFGDTMANFGSYRHEDGTVRLYRKRPTRKGTPVNEWIFDPKRLTLRGTTK